MSKTDICSDHYEILNLSTGNCHVFGPKQEGSGKRKQRRIVFHFEIYTLKKASTLTTETAIVLKQQPWC
jgi:hypothetical protein